MWIVYLLNCVQTLYFACDSSRCSVCSCRLVCVRTLLCLIEPEDELIIAYKLARQALIYDGCRIAGRSPPPPTEHVL
jgi:hypothetical protein